MTKINLDWFEEYTDKIRRAFLRIENPQNDWRVILVSGVMVLSLFVVFSFYLFIQINEGDIFISETSDDVVINSINRTLLNETLNVLREKNDLFNEIKRSKPIVIDPMR